LAKEVLALIAKEHCVPLITLDLSESMDWFLTGKVPYFMGKSDGFRIKQISQENQSRMTE
jgi:hypothetical protein